MIDGLNGHPNKSSFVEVSDRCRKTKNIKIGVVYWCYGVEMAHSESMPRLTISLADRTPGTEGSCGPAESFHGFNTDLVPNAMSRQPVASGDAPGTGDAPLWAPLASHPQAQLFTGDRLLVETPPNGASVTSLRRFMDTFFFLKET